MLCLLCLLATSCLRHSISTIVHTSMSEILRTRRAPTACSWCRQRKVRCDAALRGCPCTRCRQDGRGGCSIRTNHRRSVFCSISTNLLLYQRVWLILTTYRSKPHSPRPKGPTGDPLKYYYPFIDSQFLGSLAPEDVAFLSAKGAGTLPGEKAVDEFVREYFKRIHPSVPMIAEGGFWDVYQSGGQDGDGKVSLFVFQAILFASCPVSICLTDA